MRRLLVLLALVPGCMANAEQSAAAAATACESVTASCYCTATVTTDLRCVECTGTPQFVESCSPASGDVCCATDDGTQCTCGAGVGCVTGAGQVSVCFSGQVGGDPSPGDADPGDTGTCTTVGICSIANNTCRCGTSCRNYDVSAYTCSFACTSDDDCTGLTDPATKQPYARCQASHTVGATTFDSYCVP